MCVRPWNANAIFKHRVYLLTPDVRALRLPHLSHREYFAVPPFQCGTSSVVLESRRELLVAVAAPFLQLSACVPLCCQSRTWGAITLPFKGWLSRFGICAILLNLIKTDVLGVAGNFTALRGYYYIINWEPPLISPLVWQPPPLNSI